MASAWARKGFFAWLKAGQNDEKAVVYAKNGSNSFGCIANSAPTTNTFPCKISVRPLDRLIGDMWRSIRKVKHWSNEARQQTNKFACFAPQSILLQRAVLKNTFGPMI